MIARSLTSPFLVGDTFAVKPTAVAAALVFSFSSLSIANEVRISEFLANQGANGLEDASGAQHDWIEIHNLDPTPFDIGGHFLSDDPTVLDKWVFPLMTVIPADGYLIVFASGADSTAQNASGELHANFRLNAEIDNLLLVRPDANTVISQFNWTSVEPVQEGILPRQLAGVSSGLVGSLPDAKYLKTATPGAANDTEIFLSEIVGFSESSQTFTGTLNVELSSPDPRFRIRFTVEGETPDETSGILYTEPVTISTSTRIRARLEDVANNAVGAVTGRHFLKLSDQVIPATFEAGAASLHKFTSNLPVIILENYGGNKPTLTSEASISLTVFEPGEDGVTRLNAAPTLSSRAIMRIRGKSSVDFPKKQWRVEIQNQEGDDKDVALLGMDADSDWILNAPWVDKTFIRNSLVYELGREIGIYGMKTTPVEVFNNDDGGELNYETDYVGVYVLMEPIRIASHRIDLARLSKTQNSEPEISGGYILKFDKPDTDSFGLSGWNNLQVHEPERLSRGQLAWASRYVRDFQNATGSAMSADPVVGWRAFCDEQSFVNMMLINELTKEQDTYMFSHYLTKDRNRKLEFGPLWDYNLCFGAGIDTLDTTLWNYKVRISEGGWEARTFERDGEFRQLWVDDWTRLRRTILKDENLFARIDRHAAQFRTPEGQATGPASRNFARWDILGEPTLNEFTSPTSGTYEGQIDFIKDWLTNRMAWIDGEFTGAPELSIPSGLVPAGTVVTLTAPEDIYFTIDGQDPRLSGGEIWEGAQMIPGMTPFEVTVTQTTSIVARAKSGDEWSGPVSANYLVGGEIAAAGNLAVTEIMYHPAARTQEERDFGIKDSDHFEFVELANIGTREVDLTGVSFVEGISAIIESGPRSTLKPGGRVVLVRNREAFEYRYGTGLPIVGTYSAQLANEGEPITLVDASGVVIVTFTYNDKTPWPFEPDGGGPSLVLSSDSLDPDIAENWRKSSTNNGTPGYMEGAGKSEFDDWLSTNFTPEEIADATISGLNADPDLDGVSNSFEFLYGTRPKDFSSSAEATLAVELAEDAAFMILGFDQASQAGAIRIRVEESADLTAWIPSQAEISKTDQSVEIRSQIVEGSLQQFLRIVIVVD